MTTAIETQRQKPKELLRALAHGGMHERASQAGLNLSAFLEREDPSADYKDGTDAFTRCLMESGVVTRSCRYGSYYSDKVEKFTEDGKPERRALFAEYIARQYRSVSQGGARPQVRASAYGFDDTAINSAWRRYFIDPQVNPDTQLSPAIPLSEVVAITQPISGNLYKAAFLTRDATQTRMKRVVQFTELPVARLQESDRAIQLYKYGVQLQASYESMRRLPIDQFALYIQLLAVQAEVDKVATVLDIMVNGDGNSGTAATNYNLTTLDSAAVAGTLTLKGWLAFKMKFANPYMLRRALETEATALQMFLLNVGSANWPLTQAYPNDFGGQFTPINPGFRDGVATGWTSDAPALTIVGWDNRFAIKRLTEVGSNIAETDRWIQNQVNMLALSEVEGYTVMDTGAVKTLSVNA